MPAMTTILLTTAIMTITTSTATAMVMMAWLLLLLMILGRYPVSVPMVEQVRTDFDVRFHLLVVFAGQIITTAANRWFPSGATKGHRLVCTCTFSVVAVAATTAAAIQSIRLASLFVEFHIS